MTGYFDVTADFDPGTSTVNFTSAGGYDAYVVKLDATGRYVWAKQQGGTGLDRGLTVAVDAEGSVYTTGEFAGTVDFDPTRQHLESNECWRQRCVCLQARPERHVCLGQAYGRCRDRHRLWLGVGLGRQRVHHGDV